MAALALPAPCPKQPVGLSLAASGSGGAALPKRSVSRRFATFFCVPILYGVHSPAPKIVRKTPATTRHQLSRVFSTEVQLSIALTSLCLAAPQRNLVRQKAVAAGALAPQRSN